MKLDADKLNTQHNIFGQSIRQWRKTLGISQMNLAMNTDISIKHLSFLENGRSKPSIDMVMRLCATLAMPLKSQNALLVAAGFNPRYSKSSLDSSTMTKVRDALQRMLDHHEPYPAIVMDALGNQLMANSGAVNMLLTFLPAHILSKYPNVYDLYLSEDGLKQYIPDWQNAASVLLQQLQNELLNNSDPAGYELLNKYLSWSHIPKDWQYRASKLDQGPIFEFTIKNKTTQLRFFSALTTFGTPQDITLQELRIESFYPADKSTELWFSKS
jgi:transcriptional regulator with XRE-family HTH domain